MAFARPPAASSGTTETILTLIERAIGVATLVLVVCVVLRLAVRRGRDPLADAPPRPNRLREDALILAVLVYLLSAMVMSGLVGLAAGEAESVLGVVIVGTGVPTAGIIVCLFIAARRFDGGIHSFWIAEEATGFRVSTAVTVLVTIAALGVSPIVRDATTDTIVRLAPNFEFPPHPTIKALQDRDQPIAVLVALWGGAVVLAPVAEELFFRGLVQTFILKVVQNRWLAIALASLAFGAVHYQQPHAIPALTALALLIGYAYERTGSLIPPILIHAAFNLKTLIWDAL